MKILLAIDGSSYTEHTLAYLGAHEGLFGADARYTAMTVLPALPPRLGEIADRRAFEARNEAEARQILRSVQTFAARHRLDMATVHRTGRAGDVIAGIATEDGYDLLIMGAQGHTDANNVSLGSVTSRVLASCAVPTLLIRHP
jgi:nucleotide-binding universal stress UspA family protein